jgi:hypothetical protein
VSGGAGVGKTALAVHWGHRARDAFPGGQLYANLRGYDPGEPVSPASALAGFLRALGVPDHDIPAGTDQRSARFRALRDWRRALVVLDNAASAEQVQPLLPGTPSCVVVVTSRDSLTGLVARHGARRLDLDVPPEADAVTVLRQLTGPGRYAMQDLLRAYAAHAGHQAGQESVCAGAALALARPESTAAARLPLQAGRRETRAAR